MIWDRDLHEWVGPDPLHDREPDDEPEPDDDDFYLADETPDDRRAIIALRWRREWMSTR